MPIVPDSKNWIWVIERPCEECGFDASTLAPSAVPGVIRSNASSWPAVLERADVRERPDDSTWSPLEYSAHVRDVLRLYLERLNLMLEQENPLYPNWDQDAAAVADRYNEQNPALVNAELQQAAEAIAGAFDNLDDEQWTRRGRRSDGATFTVATFAAYFAHDIEHHRHDVRPDD